MQVEGSFPVFQEALPLVKQFKYLGNLYPSDGSVILATPFCSGKAEAQFVDKAFCLLVNLWVLTEIGGSSTGLLFLVSMVG